MQLLNSGTGFLAKASRHFLNAIDCRTLCPSEASHEANKTQARKQQGVGFRFWDRRMM